MTTRRKTKGTLSKYSRAQGPMLKQREKLNRQFDQLDRLIIAFYTIFFISSLCIIIGRFLQRGVFN